MGVSATVQIVRTSDGFLIRLHGRGTLKSSPAIEQFVQKALSAKQRVVIDLSDCDYLDSTFLGCLLKLRLQAKEPGCFALATHGAGRETLFGCSRIDEMLEFTEQVPEPISADVDLEIESLDAHELARHIMQCHRILGDSDAPDAADFRSVADRIQCELDS